MPLIRRRPNRTRLHVSASPPPRPPLPNSISLTNAELHYVLTRRLRNDNLPDDAHTLFAERITSLITILSSFFAKLYLLERTPLVHLPAKHPRLALFLRLLAVSQLRPLRILTLPLIRCFRPLSWLLAPFASLSLPVTVHVIAKYLIRQFTPTPPPRPQFVDTLVERAAEVCETVTETVTRARNAIENDMHHYFDAPPPRLPRLADIVPPPLAHLVARESSQPQPPDSSSTTAPAPSEEETLIRSPLPALRRRAKRLGLSALTGPGAGITVSSDARSQRTVNSEMGSDVGSDTAEERSWWHKASS